jgi:hypothetical protein
MATRTDDEKNKALGHLWFEVKMFNESHVLFDRHKKDIAADMKETFWNVCNDNFLLHARNLVEFSNKKNSTSQTMCPQHFGVEIDSIELSEKYNGMVLNNYLCHVSWRRIERDRNKEPSGYTDNQEISNIINEKMKEFFEELSEGFKIIKENGYEVKRQDIIDYLDKKILEAS